MVTRDTISESENNVVLHLQVKPNSKKQEIVVDSFDKKITIFVKAQPDKGKANKELLKFMAKILEKTTSDISIVAGQTSRDKTLIVKNDTKQNVESKILEFERQ